MTEARKALWATAAVLGWLVVVAVPIEVFTCVLAYGAAGAMTDKAMGL